MDNGMYRNLQRKICYVDLAAKFVFNIVKYLPHKNFASIYKLYDNFDILILRNY